MEGYLVISLVALGILWVLSEYYTDKKFDAVNQRLKDLERQRYQARPTIIIDQEPDTDPGADNNDNSS